MIPPFSNYYNERRAYSLEERSERFSNTLVPLISSIFSCQAAPRPRPTRSPSPTSSTFSLWVTAKSHFRRLAGAWTRVRRRASHGTPRFSGCAPRCGGCMYRSSTNGSRGEHVFRSRLKQKRGARSKISGLICQAWCFNRSGLKGFFFDLGCPT